MRRDSKSPLVAVRRWLLLASAVRCRLQRRRAARLQLCRHAGRRTRSMATSASRAEQEQLVKERAGALVAWHRSTQLRDYAQLIETTRRKLDGPVTAGRRAGLQPGGQCAAGRTRRTRGARSRAARADADARPDRDDAAQARQRQLEGAARAGAVRRQGDARRPRQEVCRAGRLLVRQPDARAAGHSSAPHWRSARTTPPGGSRSASGGNATCVACCSGSRAERPNEATATRLAARVLRATAEPARSGATSRVSSSSVPATPN